MIDMEEGIMRLGMVRGGQRGRGAMPHTNVNIISGVLPCMMPYPVYTFLQMKHYSQIMEVE